MSLYRIDREAELWETELSMSQWGEDTGREECTPSPSGSFCLRDAWPYTGCVPPNSSVISPGTSR